jgi:hypothetical protein
MKIVTLSIHNLMGMSSSGLLNHITKDTPTFAPSAELILSTTP